MLLVSADLLFWCSKTTVCIVSCFPLKRVRCFVQGADVFKTKMLWLSRQLRKLHRQDAKAIRLEVSSCVSWPQQVKLTLQVQWSV